MQKLQQSYLLDIVSANEWKNKQFLVDTYIFNYFHFGAHTIAREVRSNFAGYHFGRLTWI